MPDAQRFTFHFEEAYTRAGRVFGISAGRAWVDVGESDLDARFGRWRVRTPLANVSAVAVSGPYAFLKTAGPPRLAVTDRGLTFATNARRGVLISFHSPVRCLDPFGLLRHPELTVTVADVDGLVGRLRSRGT